VTHVGILLFFVSAFVALHGVEESYLTLREGQASNVSSSYHDWELSVWKGGGARKNVAAYDTKHFKAGDLLDFERLGFSLDVEKYYPNSTLQAVSLDKQSGQGVNVVLNPLKVDKEPSKNIPGGMFWVRSASTDEDAEILLFGGEDRPTQIRVGEEEINIVFRRKRDVLPFTLKLLDFIMETHPGTSMARSYKSRVEIDSHGARREILISMNKPLRYKSYTLYQSSYQIDEAGNEYSTLAVVDNAGRLLPYIATFVTFGGLAGVSFSMAFSTKKTTRKKTKS